MSDTTKKIKPLTVEMREAVDTIVTDMEINDEGNGTIKTEVFEKIILDRNGLDMDALKKLQDTIGFIQAATHIAQVEKAAPWFKEHEDVPMVTSKTKIGNATLAVRTHRSREFQIPNSDKTTTNYCQTSVIYDEPRKYARVAKEYSLDYAKSILAD